MGGLLTRYRKLAVIWAVSLVAMNVVASRAQAPTPLEPTPQDTIVGQRTLLEGPVIVSGNDVGFRIERTKDNIPVGKLVIRIDGRWVDTELLATAR
jgi:hypothetical protein